MFHFISHRCEQGSLNITSNLEFSRWIEVFVGPTLTSALLEHQTHQAPFIQFEGESYRFMESVAAKSQEVTG